MELNESQILVLRIWDSINGDFSPLSALFSFSRDDHAFSNIKGNWKESPDSHIFTADLPELKAEEGYIRDEPFDPLKWIAPGTYCTRVVKCRCEEMKDKSIKDDEIVVKIGKACNKDHRWMTSKTISDAIEALIGAYMVGGGLDAAYHVMNWMGIQVMFKSSELKPIDIHPNILKKVKIIDLESQIGYVFQNKALLVEAMPRASAQDIEECICYQLSSMVFKSIFSTNSR